MALSEHGSVKYHIDWMDDARINAWVIPLGDFGDVGGMASRHLAAEEWWAELSPGARQRHLNLIKRFD
ncbi:hypothetical protein K474DRAFT_1710830 [Panus rudis PR-1116 ss-1]|nr:hypothetical protein K474DRAFT_1710830 [Panus rudis PR-1116 ss-1]